MLLFQELPNQILLRALGYAPITRERPAAVAPLTGRVCIEGQSAEVLAGHIVELRMECEPAIRTRGVIDSEGVFHLAPLGESNKLIAGHYQARLVLGSGGQGRARAFRIPWQYMVYSTSGWSVDLPTTNELEFVLSV